MDEPIRTARLALVPTGAEDADELAEVFADERLYAFTGGRPGTVEELRDLLDRLARERAAGPEGQLNWVARRLADDQAVGCSRASSATAGGRPRSPGWRAGASRR
jgi:hypothetical protein